MNAQIKHPALCLAHSRCSLNVGAPLFFLRILGEKQRALACGNPAGIYLGGLGVVCRRREW